MLWFNFFYFLQVLEKIDASEFASVDVDYHKYNMHIIGGSKI